MYNFTLNEYFPPRIKTFLSSNMWTIPFKNSKAPTVGSYKGIQLYSIIRAKQSYLWNIDRLGVSSTHPKHNDNGIPLKILYVVDGPEEAKSVTYAIINYYNEICVELFRVRDQQSKTFNPGYCDKPLWTLTCPMFTTRDLLPWT